MKCCFNKITAENSCYVVAAETERVNTRQIKQSNKWKCSNLFVSSNLWHNSESGEIFGNPVKIKLHGLNGSNDLT